MVGEMAACNFEKYTQFWVQVNQTSHLLSGNTHMDFCPLMYVQVNMQTGTCL